MTTKKVAIYSTKTCHYWQMAKELFKERGIKFDEFDVGADLVRRREMVDKSGQMGVPVITIGDDLIVGFDEARINESLAA